MKDIRKPIFIGAAARALSGLAASGIVAVSLVSAGLVTAAVAQVTPLANTGRDAVQFSQMMEAGRDLQLGETGAAASSRSYYQRVTGADLSKGVDLVTQSSGAVVRLTPIGTSAASPLRRGTGATTSTNGAALRMEDLEISRGGAEPVAVARPGAAVADAAALRSAQPGLFRDTLAFNVGDDLGKGRLRLRSRQQLAGAQEYMIHVFDKESALQLRAETDRMSYFLEDGVTARAELTGAAMRRRAEIRASLIGPNGQRFPLDVRRNGKGLDITGRTPKNVNVVPGELWRVAISYRDGEGDAPLFRDVEAPIALGKRSAAISRVRAARDGVKIAVNVSDAGRFEARAWVFARKGDGAAEGAMLAYAAEWLDAGRNTLTLTPDVEALKAAGYRAPFEIRQVQLLDQSRLMVLDTQNANGLSLKTR
ncbi:MAG: DUF4785 domain-containing protein [Pseudomonadota bacterium]